MRIFGLRKRTLAFVLFPIGIVVIFGSLNVSHVIASQPSEQVIFSGTGIFNETSSLAGSPFGFWVWCEANSQNPYAGECNGTVYVYALHLTKHVDGEITEPSDGFYVMTVASRDGSISAMLRNLNQAVTGPHNTIDATFVTPAVGDGTSTTAVVSVTGPKS